MSNLVSGLNERINKTKLVEESDSKAYNELLKVTNGIISFVKRNPDITNHDVKILALKDNQMYISLLFSKFPNLVEEIRNNGSKNILDFVETKKEISIYDEIAYKLNKLIDKNFKNHQNNLTLILRHKYCYESYKLDFKMKNSELIFTEEYKDMSGSTSYCRGVSNLSMKELAQIVSLVECYQKWQVTEDALRETIKNNYMYDFSVIEMIFDARNSILEELKQDIYGMIRLIDLYRYLVYNKKQQGEAELI